MGLLYGDNAASSITSTPKIELKPNFTIVTLFLIIFLILEFLLVIINLLNFLTKLIFFLGLLGIHH